MPKDEDEPAKKIIEAGKKFSAILKEKSRKFAEAMQDFSFVAAEMIKEKSSEFAAAASKKTAEFSEVASKKTGEFSKIAKEKGTEFVKKTSEKTAELAKIADARAREFAEITSAKTSEFAKVASAKTSEFAKATSEKTAEFARESAKDIKVFTKITSKKTKIFLKTSAKKTKDAALLLRPLKPREKFEASKLAECLNKNEYELVVGWLKQGKAAIDIKKYDWSFLISGKNHFPRIISEEQFTKELNDKIKKAFMEERFREFSERAWNAVPQYVAPTVIGMLEAKQATVLQLFSGEPLHIILIGDLYSGKTEIFESVKQLSPAFGLQANDGICISFSEGRKVRPGGLVRAGKNLCTISKLHLLRREDELILYRTLETGYISYNTKSGRRRYDAPASILAECSPRYGSFENFSLEALKKQLPLDPYLVGRFHAAIFTKKAGLEKFADIAEKIIVEHKVIMKQDDMDFIKRYAEFARKVDVELPAHLAGKIKEFAVVLKEREPDLPYKITPQAIVGIIRMAKASARMELRSQIESKDLERVFNLMNKITKIAQSDF